MFIKQIVIKVPDNKHAFFLELIKSLGFDHESNNEYVLSTIQNTRKRSNNKVEEPEAANWSSVKKEKQPDKLSKKVPEWHKELVKKRIVSAKESDYISLDRAKNKSGQKEKDNALSDIY